MAAGGTSVPNLSWVDIEIPLSGGRLAGAKEIDHAPVGYLLLPSSLLLIEGKAA